MPDEYLTNTRLYPFFPRFCLPIAWGKNQPRNQAAQTPHRLELSYLAIPDDQDRYFCPIPLLREAILREQSLRDGLAEDLEDYRHELQAKRPSP